MSQGHSVSVTRNSSYLILVMNVCLVLYWQLHTKKKKVVLHNDTLIIWINNVQVISNNQNCFLFFIFLLFLIHDLNPVWPSWSQCIIYGSAKGCLNTLISTFVRSCWILLNSIFRNFLTTTWVCDNTTLSVISEPEQGNNITWLSWIKSNTMVVPACC